MIGVVLAVAGIMAQAGIPDPIQWGVFTCGTVDQLQAQKWVKSNVEISGISITDSAEYPYLGEEKHVHVSFAATNRSDKFAFATLNVFGVGQVGEAGAAPLFALQATTLNGVSAKTTQSGFGFTYTEGNALEEASLICWQFGAAELF